MIRPLKTVKWLVAAGVLWGAGFAHAEDFLLTGKVSDGSGNPVEDAEIFIYDSASTRRPADYISPRTRKDGVYGIRLPKAKYWVVARVRKGEKYGPLLPGDRHSGEPVDIDPGGDREVIKDFVVADIREVAQNRQKTRDDYYRLSGRVIDSRGKPVQNAYVFAREEDAKGEVPPYLSRWTGERGEYVIFLPPGKYVVRGAYQFPPESKKEGLKEMPVDVVRKETKLDVEIDAETPDPGGHPDDSREE